VFEYCYIFTIFSSTPNTGQRGGINLKCTIKKHNRSITRPVLRLATLITLLIIMTSSPVAAQECQSLSDNQDYRLVMQVIDGQLYKWLECSAENGLNICLLEPEYKMLDDSETEELLQASQKWLNNYNVTTQTGQQVQLEKLVDNRTALENNKSLAYPYNTIGIMMIDFGSDYIRGSGFLVGPYTVLTNAHNLYSSGMGGWHRSARFSPGQYETSWPESYRPFSTLQAVKSEVNQTFLRYESYDDRENLIRYDYAALFFEQPFEGINTFMPLQFNHIPSNVSVVGYPGYIRDKPSQGQWLAEGKILSHDTHCLFYDAITSGGSSGSPVFEYNREAGTYRVVAIHSFAYENQQISGGPHLNSLNAEQIESWLRWTPESPENQSVFIALDKTGLTLEVGAIEALIVSVTPSEYAATKLIWSSSNSAIASVDTNGLISAVKVGSAIITVKTADEKATATCTVTVKNQSGQIDQIGSAIKGDLNGDQIINIQDVIMAYQHILELRQLPGDLIILADVNDDGLVDVRDVSLIMRRTLGLISSFGYG
jgi:V8-like Glu-specific endopeptidase